MVGAGEGPHFLSVNWSGLVRITRLWFGLRQAERESVRRVTGPLVRNNSYCSNFVSNSLAAPSAKPDSTDGVLKKDAKGTKMAEAERQKRISKPEG